MDSIISEGLACIPAIHIYLKDLIFIDTAHPVSEEPQLRETKIDQVLSKVSKLQESAYQNLNKVSPECTKYMSNAYIEYLHDDVLQVRMQNLFLFLKSNNLFTLERAKLTVPLVLTIFLSSIESDS